MAVTATEDWNQPTGYQLQRSGRLSQKCSDTYHPLLGGLMVIAYLQELSSGFTLFA